VYSGGSGRPYLVEGIGEDFWPTTYDPSLVDEVIPISDGESFRVARRVTQEEGILIGGSGGTAVAAALEVARRSQPDDLVVCLIPDSGRGYLSRVFEDSWLAGFGFLEEPGVSVRSVLEARGQTPRLLYVNPEDNVHKAIALMREHDISQIPVCKNEPPFAAAEVAGALDELEIMELAVRDPSVLDAEVGKVMGPKLPSVGIGQPLGTVVDLLETNPALLVLADGRPMAVLTRSDVLGFLTAAHDAEFHPGGR
jgi:cystathionine beta-synthase